ncbi:hypothetical protein HDR61_03935 [bacterium]|nr:hypothetical protein [bacterium]
MNAFQKYLFYKKLMDQLDCTSNPVTKKDSPDTANSCVITWNNAKFMNKDMNYKVTSYREDNEYYTKVNIKDKPTLHFGKRLSKKLYHAAYRVAAAQEQQRMLNNIMHKLLMTENQSR